MTMEGVNKVEIDRFDPHSDQQKTLLPPRFRPERDHMRPVVVSATT